MLGRQMMVCAVVVICVVDSFAQTFQYSHGWTSGKKRSSLLGALSAHAGVDREEPYDLAHDLTATPTTVAAAATLRRLALEDSRRVCKMILSIADGQNCFKIKEDFFKTTDDA